MSFQTTKQADEDISDIFVYGALTFGERQAEEYQDGLFRTFALLADNPHLAHERAELGEGVRLYRYRAHMIVYAVLDRHILIVRVLHGRQDWEAHLP